tara:strand:+ start:193 stop:519 length:327 start_codon:yes stop_codon:yes gene_type:complete
MSCFKSKVKPVQNEIFDLMDMNGDNVVGKNEIALVAKFVLQADIERAQIYLESLKVADPVKHIEKYVGKTVTKAELRHLYPRVDHNIWINQILPQLKRKEIERLKETL